MYTYTGKKITFNLYNIIHRQMPIKNEITDGSVTTDTKILQKATTSALKLLVDIRMKSKQNAYVYPADVKIDQDTIENFQIFQARFKKLDQETPGAGKTPCESVKDNACPSGHILLYELQTELGWRCDAGLPNCKCFPTFDKYGSRYRCPKCDFDICMDCFEF